jgi:hypothetical protein
MGIGGSIFLIAVGAIIAFGVRDQSFGPFDLNVIGWVLMIVGFVGLALTMYIWSSRRRRVIMQQPPAVERHYVQQPPGTVVEDEPYDVPPERPRY